MEIPVLRRRRVMLATAVASFVAMLLVGAFVTTIEVTTDRAIVEWCRSQQRSSFDAIMLWLSATGRSVALIPISLVASIFLLVHRKYRLAAYAALVMAIAPIASLQAKELFKRARPDVLSLDPQSSFAYPSGHATASAVAAIATLLVCDQLGIRRSVSACVAAWAIGVSVSRVWLGAHFPTDIIGGWLLALSLTSLLAAVLLPSNHAD